MPVVGGKSYRKWVGRRSVPPSGGKRRLAPQMLSPASCDREAHASRLSSFVKWVGFCLVQCPWLTGRALSPPTARWNAAMLPQTVSAFWFRSAADSGPCTILGDRDRERFAAEILINTSSPDTYRLGAFFLLRSCKQIQISTSDFNRIFLE